MDKKLILALPEQAGCYLMKNKENELIYVGKAKNIKKRVSSYFNLKQTGKTQKLVEEITNIDYIVVNNEKESLILEMNLIKKHNPKYNILMRDDKSYPYIELVKYPEPKLRITRTLNKNKTSNHLFGPYPNTAAARIIVDLLNRIYPLKKCNSTNKKPCTYYYMGQCPGYCFKEVDKEIINKTVSDVTKFLNGNHNEITKLIKKKIINHSEKLEFELAKELKEILDSIEIILEKQRMEINENHSIDIVGYHEIENTASITILFARNGKIIGNHQTTFEIIEDIQTETVRYLANFYEQQPILPKEIVINTKDNKYLSEYLNVKVTKPTKGTKKQLIQIAEKNSQEKINTKYKNIIDKDKNANLQLKEILKLEKLEKIEIFDVSHLFGQYNVGAMIVFENGKPEKNQYRKYKIKSEKSDEYSSLKEMIYRRYIKLLKDNQKQPDLIIIDGGIAQLNTVKEILKSFDLSIKVLALAKNQKHKTNEIIDGDSKEEIKIEKGSHLFFYLEKIQEEVHRFTINYHRQIRSKGLIESELDQIKGLGKKQRENLIQNFKTIKNIKEGSVEELSKVVTKNAAKAIVEYFKGENNG
jgi:excinuclease ABC subunit C